MRLQVTNRFSGIVGKLGERLREVGGSPESLIEHHEVDGQRKQRVRFGAEVGNAIADRGVHDRIGIEFVGNGFVVPFEQVLIEAAILIEQLQRRFESLGEAVNRGAVEALEIDAAHLEDDPDLSALGEKYLGADEPEEIDLLGERAGFVVVLEYPADPKHDDLFGLEWG